jgi:hypothetical protein
MPTDIKCPKCGHQFPMEEAVSEEYKKALRAEMQAYKEKKDSELAKRENEYASMSAKKETEFSQKLQQEKLQLQQSLETSLRKTIATDFENKVKLLEQNNQDNEEKLKLSRQKELEFLQKEQALKRAGVEK